MSEQSSEMSEKTSEMREIVIPGEILSENPSMIPGRGAIKSGDKITSIYIGLKDIRGKYVNVVPLRGYYTPAMGDKIIGKVVGKTPVKWRIDINTKSTGFLRPADAVERVDKRGQRGGGRKKDDMNMYKVGDIVLCQILSYDRVSDATLTTLGESLGPITDGLIISVDVPKVPRIIGKRGSMIKLLKTMTDCRLFVTKNGRIWIKGKNELNERLLIDAIYKIEREAHTTGLTDRIQNYIKEEKIKRGIQ